MLIVGAVADLNQNHRQRECFYRPGTNSRRLRRFHLLPSRPSRVRCSISGCAKYSRSSLNYAVEYDLHLMRSNMQPRIGQIEGYDNNVQVATKDMKLGSNEHVNSTSPVVTQQVVAPQGPLLHTILISFPRAPRHNQLQP